MLLMFKAILLGQWHSLSDAALEQTLCVRIDFLQFCGFVLVGRDTGRNHTCVNQLQVFVKPRGLVVAFLIM